MSLMKSEQFYERQLKERHRIGFHTLILLLFLSLASGLWREAFGEWASPMDETLILFMVCLAFFLVRTILRDAQFDENSVRVFGTICIALVLVWILLFSIHTFRGDMVLVQDGMLTSRASDLVMALAWLTILTALLTRRHRDRKAASMEEDE